MYVAPTQKQARELIWEELKAVCPSQLIKKKLEQQLELHLINGSTIMVRGSDAENSIRGHALDLLIMDEAAFQKREIWDVILRPSLADRIGSAVIASTPNGNNWFKEQEAVALTDKEWKVYHYTIYDNPHLSHDEINKIKDSLLAQGKDLVWEQEYLAEYVDKVGTVYCELTEDNIADLSNIPRRLTAVGLDWGVGDEATSAVVSVLSTGQVYFESYTAVNNTSSTEAASIILRNVNSLGICPRIWKLDASSFKRERDLGSVSKDYQRAGIPCSPATKDLDSSISYVKSLLTSKKLIVNSNLQRILIEMRKWQYGQHEPDILAAMRYAIAGLAEAGYIANTGIDAWKVNNSTTSTSVMLNLHKKKSDSTCFTFKR